MTDPIADMLTRIRNAINVGKNEVDLPHSKVKEGIARLLVANGFLEDVKVDSTKGSFKYITVVINSPGTNAKITDVTRVSKPGRRQYVGNNSIPIIKNGRGIVVLSTSQGLMTGEEAKEKRMGGELICRVY